jgi:hypothetical protein
MAGFQLKCATPLALTQIEVHGLVVDIERDGLPLKRPLLHAT